MKTMLTLAALVAATFTAHADVGLISVADAKALIENPDAAKRPIVLDTRGGYKDYFRGHLPTAHHINFDTLRGTAEAVPVQYLPDDLTKALLIRAGADKDRLHLVYATGAELPNDEILSTTMVVYVLEKFGVKNIKIVDGGIAEWKKQGFEPARDYFGNPAGSLPAEGNPGIAANVDDVQGHVGKPGNVLVDARPLNEFQGDDDVWLRKGHIPGAISFHWARLVEKDNTHKFKPFSDTKAELEKLVAATHAQLGKIDVLVCNAAVNPFYGSMRDLPDEAFQKILGVNIMANHWLVNLVLPEMIERKDGSIIIVSSIGGLRGHDTLGAYCISKAADLQLVRNLAVEHGQHNVRVNAISPGLIRTDFARALWENPVLLAERTINDPLRRIGEPDEIAGIAVYLASRASSFTTGQNFVIDGGSTI
jgi:thiosulfate/3-mercaptopyruvate sulfurtransferase